MKFLMKKQNFLLKKVKAIDMGYYQVSLYEASRGYIVTYSRMGEDKESENIKNYLTADYLFNIKVEELQGH